MLTKPSLLSFANNGWGARHEKVLGKFGARVGRQSILTEN